MFKALSKIVTKTNLGIRHHCNAWLLYERVAEFLIPLELALKC
jgi:hypothetical protein